MSIEKEIAEQITRIRKAAGVTQKQLSELTGVTQADISKLERGKSNPNIQTLERLAAALGKTLKVTFFNEKGTK